MATLALTLAMGGTAIAAVTLTGRNVADRSLTAADVKNGSLGVADLSAATRASLRGAKGNTGYAGSQGSMGATGEDGERGDRGSAAFMTSAFAYRDTGLVTQRTGVLPPNDNAGTGKDWDSATYASNDDPTGIPQIRAAGQYNAVNLTNQWQPVISLTGDSGADATRSPNTLLNLTFTDAYLNATASLTFLHRAHLEDLATNSGGTPIHGRVECRLFYGTGSVPAALSGAAGMPAQASAGGRDLRHELMHMGLNGNAQGLVSGTQYNVTVKCRDADYTGQPQWQLARANLTAFASR